MSTQQVASRPDARIRFGLLFVGILLIAANLRAAITSVGPVLGGITADLHLGATTASVLTSIPLLAFAALSPVAPALAARIGTERALGLSLLTLAVAIVLRSMPGPVLLWVGTALLGAAIALLNVLLPALVKRDYPNAVGTVTGLYSAVQSAAAALAAGFAVPLAGVDQHGWRLALGIWAGLAVLALAVFAPQLRQRTVPGAATAPDTGRSPWRTALGWQVTAFMGLQSTLYYTVITWWPSVEQSEGVSPATAGWHMFGLQIVSIAGNLASAALLRRARDQRGPVLICTAAMVAGVAGELLAPQAALLWALCIGFGIGSSIVLALSLFGLRTRAVGAAARLSGMAQAVGYLVAAVGPVLLGMLHDATGGWSWPLGALLVILLGQVSAGLLAGRNRYLDG